MTAELIDIGCNLTHESFTPDRAAVIARARGAGVRGQIVTGADLASSREAARLARTLPQCLWSTAGIHPHHAAEFDSASREEITELARLPEVVAVGECGLDFFRNFSTPSAQRRAFTAQLELAAEMNLPVFLHQRDAHAEFMAILEDYRGSIRGVAHCFTGGLQELECYLDLGLSIGVTGWVCDERRGDALRAAVPSIPLDRLMIETDAPYLLPRDLASKPATRRNEPAYLPHVARRVALLCGVSLERLADTTTRNARTLFSLAPPD